MENEFVPYEQALELKTLGFDGATSSFWKNNKLVPLPTNGEIVAFHVNRHSSTNVIWISAPLWQQAFKWFWNTQGLYVEFFVDDDQTFGFLISRFVEEGRMDYPSKRGYSNPEIAEFNCLKALIEMVKSI